MNTMKRETWHNKKKKITPPKPTLKSYLTKNIITHEIYVLKKSSKFQENTDRILNEMKRIHEQNENINWDIQSITKNKINSRAEEYKTMSWKISKKASTSDLIVGGGGEDQQIRRQVIWNYPLKEAKRSKNKKEQVKSLWLVGYHQGKQYTHYRVPIWGRRESQKASIRN